jgi:hypothetical protein
MTPGRQGALIFLAALAVAAAGTRNHAGGWNDGSRLAAAESLADRGTWAIDGSSFETMDKLRIGGRYYSDKPPVPNLLLAADYRAWRALTGRTVRSDAAGLCRALTVASSGLAYAVAVWAAFLLAVRLGLPVGLRLALTLSFACGSVAWAYAGYVNSHVQLLAVATLALAEVVCLRAEAPAWRVACLGCLGGLGYTLELGAGPLLLAALGLWVLLRLRRPGLVAAFAVAALPWLALHHGLNYAVAGTWRPANAVPEYLDWPGSPFSGANMTGRWNHAGPGAFVVYALNLLVGRRGFLWHNPPLLLAVAGAWSLWRNAHKAARNEGGRAELLLACGYAVGVWLLYAATSVNGSGQCCSVRWFVPLLAPGYFVLALLLRDRPDLRRDFAVLAGVGLVLGPVMAWLGAWDDPQWLHWPTLGVTLASWAACRAIRRKRHFSPEPAAA